MAHDQPEDDFFDQPARQRRYADAEKMFGDVIEAARETNQPATVSEAWYNFAVAEAGRGRVDQAFADLGRAVADGLIAPGALAAEPGLQSLHTDPRFDAIVAKAHETAAARTRK